MRKFSIFFFGYLNSKLNIHVVVGSKNPLENKHHGDDDSKRIEFFIEALSA